METETARAGLVPAARPSTEPRGHPPLEEGSKAEGRSESEAGGEARIQASPDALADCHSREPDFPGCRPITLKREDLVHYEGRLEYWSATTETAWVVSEPTSAIHEQPGSRLAALSAIIAAVRGSPIECFGTMDLLVRDEQDREHELMQADQTAYLHPRRALLPKHAMEIGVHTRPNVVLEVDHTTDARQAKLERYESWGFPEVWLDVPEADSDYTKNRPAGLKPGLTIYLLENGAYRIATESAAFPGWTAQEIHRALNEEERSVETHRVLTRVGNALGKREGTGPDDTPWLRDQREQSRAEGERRALGRGRIEGGRNLLIFLAGNRFGAAFGAASGCRRFRIHRGDSQIDYRLRNRRRTDQARTVAHRPQLTATRLRWGSCVRRYAFRRIDGA